MVKKTVEKKKYIFHEAKTMYEYRIQNGTLQRTSGSSKSQVNLKLSKFKIAS